MHHHFQNVHLIQLVIDIHSLVLFGLQKTKTYLFSLFLGTIYQYKTQSKQRYLFKILYKDKILKLMKLKNNVLKENLITNK